MNSVEFRFFTRSATELGNGYVSVYSPYFIDAKGHKVDAGKAGVVFPEPLRAAMFYTERTKEGVFRIMPVVKDPPVDAPYRNDARVEFQVALGGGGVQPSDYKPLDPNTQLKFEPSILQTVDDPQNKGTYAANLKLGDTPGKNWINAIGSVTASVPSYDAQGNETLTDKTLAAYYPIEIWGLKLTVPSYQQLVLNSEGYPVADVEFKYEILPADYQVIPASLAVEIIERSPTRSETLFGFVPADSNGKIILSKGMAKFDVNNTYYAQVVLNRGPREVRSEKIKLANASCSSVEPITDLAQCQNRVQATWTYQYDGCTYVPDDPTGVFVTSFVNDAHTGACDEHDRCYQTCWNGDLAAARLACDQKLLSVAINTCREAQVIVDQLLVEECLRFANDYYLGLRIGAESTFKQRQKEVCLCCN